MGVDISIHTDNDAEVFSDDYHDPKHNYFSQHSLSRTFCNFMCRQNVANGEPELDQIGQLTGVDISPIYQMESYTGNEELDFFLESASTEEDRQKILRQAQQSKDNLKGNINKVLQTINALIEKLSKFDSLPDHLNNYGQDTLNSKTYFSRFNNDNGDGYINNNFGQDLRNFRRFLEYAMSKGAATVYFNYG